MIHIKEKDLIILQTINEFENECIKDEFTIDDIRKWEIKLPDTYTKRFFFKQLKISLLLKKLWESIKNLFKKKPM